MCKQDPPYHWGSSSESGVRQQAGDWVRLSCGSSTGGPWTCSIRTAWEVGRQAESQVPPGPPGSDSALHKTPRRLACTRCLRIADSPEMRQGHQLQAGGPISVTVAPAAVWLLCLPRLEEDEGGQKRGSRRQGGKRGGWGREMAQRQAPCCRAGGLGKGGKRRAVGGPLDSCKEQRARGSRVHCGGQQSPTAMREAS